MGVVMKHSKYIYRPNITIGLLEYAMKLQWPFNACD